METWSHGYGYMEHGNTDIRHGNMEKCRHGDIKTGHGHDGHGDMGMETSTWRHAHRDMDMETWQSETENGSPDDFP
jgi:hypothetical protein